MGKFKDLIEGKERLNSKERIDEAVGGVVSTPAINGGSAVANGRRGNATQGDSRIDTGGKFTYNAGELDGFEGSTRSNPKEAFEESSSSGNLVLHEDDGGSVMVRESGEGYDMVIRAGSQEKVFELDESAAERAVKFFT